MLNLLLQVQYFGHSGHYLISTWLGHLNPAALQFDVCVGSPMGQLNSVPPAFLGSQSSVSDFASILGSPRKLGTRQPSFTFHLLWASFPTTHCLGSLTFFLKSWHKLPLPCQFALYNSAKSAPCGHQQVQQPAQDIACPCGS